MAGPATTMPSLDRGCEALRRTGVTAENRLNVGDKTPPDGPPALGGRKGHRQVL